MIANNKSTSCSDASGDFADARYAMDHTNRQLDSFVTQSSVWACPQCRGSLYALEDHLGCTPCEAHYPMIEGIPDFRLVAPAWIDFDEDRRMALQLIAAVPCDDVEAAVRFVFSRKEGWSKAKIERRIRQVLIAPERLQKDLSGWLRPIVSNADCLLDLGCGPGMLLAAAAARGQRVIGIDVSLVWLVVARRMIRAAGGQPVLAAGLAEHLPLADGSMPRIAVLDMIEHAASPAPVLAEVNRVLKPGGILALATPNRFSLAAEPHVGVWGVGWLPRVVQGKYVELRTGLPYSYTRLLSAAELARLFREHTSIQVLIKAAKVPSEEISSYSIRRTILAHIYNRLIEWGPTAWLFRWIGPFMQVIGRRH